jgi:hypothetical protein
MNQKSHNVQRQNVATLVGALEEERLLDFYFLRALFAKPTHPLSGLS